MLLLQIIFWVSIFALLHTYILYPLLLFFLARDKKPNPILFQDDEFPEIQVFMAVFNEIGVISEKVESLLALNYPKEKLSFYISSDNSSDGTNEVLESYARKDSRIFFKAFTSRQGKPKQINQLVQIAKEKAFSSEIVYLMTDASVILHPECLRKMVAHYKNPDIFLVDANMLSTGLEAGEVAKAEGAYIANEVRVKYWESVLWGKMIGPFGGCYTIRANYFEEVPETFIVDDFYITMKGYEYGGQAINELNALCYEKVGMSSHDEFNRKARISSGNFQNLMTFHKLWFPPTDSLGFAFFSHKVLRWLGPFFIIFAALSLAGMYFAGTTVLYQFLFYCTVIWFIVLPALNKLLQSVNISIGPIKTIAYFNAMNWALLLGFFKYINGIKSNIWQPPKRQ